METLNYREILVKKPFYEVTPKGYMKHGPQTEEVSDYNNMSMPSDTMYRNIKTQADFLREYYPSGHKIWDPLEYPDIWKKDPDSGQWYKQPISRTAFAFQQLIAAKHTLHLTGNDVQFELADAGEDLGKEENQTKTLNTFKRGWLLANMEIVHFEAVNAYMTVAEAAVVGYMHNGKFGAKPLSFKNGDYLYPHFDSITGELELFARKYYDYDEDGVARIEWVEVWDDTYLYRYKNDVANDKSIKDKVLDTIKDIFGMNGYALVTKEKHGFPFIPVAYCRNEDGPCWSPVQKLIEDYELAFSYLCENNKAYAFPIFYVKGDGDDISVIGDDMTGAVKSIAMNDKDNDAGFLNGTDASDAFATQLNKTYELIYELSFTVKPPELKSGDLPGVAIKLLYSPALEIAMNDAQKLQPFLDKLVDITKFGVGLENNMTATMMGLGINAWIKCYIHSNSQEVINNIATAVQNGFLSKQTASERCPEYTKNAEWERILAEKKEEQEQDLLMDLERQDNETENAIEEAKQTAKINGSTGNVRTGRGAGRPREGAGTDKWGNHPGENNWDDYNNSY
jgi:hypothetical protein